MEGPSVHARGLETQFVHAPLHPPPPPLPGFGDSCKFLHDRGDYKAGWQLDREWDAKHAAGKGGARGSAAGVGADPDADNPFLIRDEPAGGALDDTGLPFACFICRGPFAAPVQTQCGHYFCEACASARYSSDTLCAACGKQTHGIFNAAPKLIARLRAAGRLREEEEEGKAGEEGAGEEAAGGWAACE